MAKVVSKDDILSDARIVGEVVSRGRFTRDNEELAIEALKRFRAAVESAIGVKSHAAGGQSCPVAGCTAGNDPTENVVKNLIRDSRKHVGSVLSMRELPRSTSKKGRRNMYRAYVMQAKYVSVQLAVVGCIGHKDCKIWNSSSKD